MAFLPPVVVGVQKSRDTVIECEDRTVTVRRDAYLKVEAWLTANGVEHTQNILVEQTIGAIGGRVRCTLVALTENRKIKPYRDDHGEWRFETEDIDVPMTAAPEAFGL